MAFSSSIRRKLIDIDKLKVLIPDLIITEEGDIHIIKTHLFGPVDTIYENKKWLIEIKLFKEYPFKAPEVKFIDPIFHPNISSNTGVICLDVIKNKWTPIFNLNIIIETLLPQLLTYPNPDSALNTMASRLYKSDIELYNQKVNELYELTKDGKYVDIEKFYEF